MPKAGVQETRSSEKVEVNELDDWWGAKKRELTMIGGAICGIVAGCRPTNTA